MPRKKSVRLAADWFREKADDLVVFASEASTRLTDAQQSWMYEYAVIRLYREFELLMLEGIVGAINNDTETISRTVGIPFPKHLTDEVCEYLVLGTGYFDFRGRDGLIQKLKKFVPDDHYLVTIVKKLKYRDSIEKLTTLRNYAAHDSYQAKKAAMAATGMNKIGSAGSWLKCQGRFGEIVDDLRQLAHEVKDAAPY